ncbi:hypothetical protein KPH14_007753 [Odynerus spinipes]|uniref:Uncharacterized protein n=1 Tax=Odynerus spinipes TaxID=1348599 RepID=A0AAD9RIZ7_9HYME|nr:hypothetical protein KPH14_007753 [Odynerus spinipes]
MRIYARFRSRTYEDRSISTRSKGVVTSDQLRTGTTILRKLRTCPMSCVEKIKRLYRELRPRRVIGFRCDISKCPSSLLECSMGPCKKDVMTFEVIDHGKMDPSIKSPFQDEVL